MRLRWKLVFGLAILNDYLDMKNMKNMRLIGSTLDVATTAVFWKTMGARNTVPAVLEQVPGFRKLPIYTLTASYAYYDEEGVKGMKDMYRKRKIEVK